MSEKQIRSTPRRDAPKAWGDDVPLRGPNAPRNDGKIKHLIEYLLTVYERFGNTVVTNDLQWGATALHKLHEERERIEALEAELAALRDTRSETEQTSPNGLWVVWYEDPAKQHESFFGEGAEAAARARYKSAYDHWSCHLLRRVPHGK